VRLRLLERVGRAIRFSPEGRAVRVWVRGMPGADETEVVAGTLTNVTDTGALLTLAAPAEAASGPPDAAVERTAGGPGRSVRVVPHESGWGFHALWFSFIAVDVFELDGGAPERRWFIRLGSPS